ncbi:MAG: FtsW/RodA/SpoVE family cell cycle protein [Clostridiales Family XIII bacterium]|nr:FtsW/RodA/SpoVE family cell cycle protein [Clostridiales Family XIII bacterium]
MFFELFKRIDKVLLTLPALLGAISCLMISSIDATAAAPYAKAVIIQIVAYAIGYGLLIAAVAFDYKHFFRFDKLLYAAAVAVQCLVFVPGLGEEIYGTRAWINLGAITLQPSEFVKVLFVLVFGAYLTRHRDDLKTFAGFLLAFLYGLPIAALVAYVDMGAGIVLFVMLVLMIFAAGLRAGLFARLALVFVICVPVVYRFLEPHQKERFAAFLHPDDLSIDAVHQVYQAKVAIGSGGFFGKGYRQGIIKESGLLPVQDSDFIFPIICEEFGLVGGFALLVIYAVLFVRIWWTVAKATELFGALIAIGFLCMFGFQIFENIGMAMGLMPVTGITLPFISAGGSSVVAGMASVGLIMSVHFRDTSRGLKYL